MINDCSLRELGEVRVLSKIVLRFLFRVFLFFFFHCDTIKRTEMGGIIGVEIRKREKRG